MTQLTLSPANSRFNEREFEFTKHDFDRVRDLIYRQAGISLSEIKQDMVYSRLTRRLRARECSTFQQYLDWLEEGDAVEKQAFVNALTTNLTSFFREPHHFDILRKHLQRLGSGRPIRIWCSAASTGEEAYSIAIIACEAFDTLAPPVQIVATDIDTSVLEFGRKGIYQLDRVEQIDAERLKRFFLKGRDAGNVSLLPELMKLIRFSQANLLDHVLKVVGPFDVIFCRNVMIYFDKSTQRVILEKFAPLLSDDGLLFAGHSENFLHSADLFRSTGRTVYERVVK
jgi:chemotaxis protein methyltransferase CheR